MASDTDSKKKKDAAKTAAATDKNTDDAIPDDMKEFIQKKQAATGKTYTVRQRKPEESISHMLIHGAPGSQNEPVTCWGRVAYPLALAIVFAISLLVFHYAPHDQSHYGPGRFRLPPKNQRKRAAPVLNNNNNNNNNPPKPVTEQVVTEDPKPKGEL